MFQPQANNIRGRLRLTASALVFAAAAVTTGASASDVTVASGGTYSWASGTNFVVGNGVTAELWDYTPSSAPATAGNAVINTGSAGTWVVDTGGTVQIASGGTVVIKNWYWSDFNSVFTAAAGSNLVIDQYDLTILAGTNTLLGNIQVTAGNRLAFGQNWTSAALTFGDSTNFTLDSGSSLDFWLSNSPTMGGTISGSGATTIDGGTLTINGKNTAATAYTGTMTVAAGGTLMIGDATHSSAVFGDVTNKSTTLTVSTTDSAIGVLKGYGTIYGQVTNAGIVKPGGTSGSLGTLTINGSYTQSSSGQLVVEVSPTGASSLAVNGAATLDGSLVVNLDSGTYGNAIYNVFSATSITGGFSTISTTGNTTGAIVGLQQTSTSYNIVTEKASASQTFGHVVAANRNALYQFSRSLYDVIAFGAPAGSTAVSGGKVDVWVAPIGEIENVGRNDVGYEVKSYGLSLGAEHRFEWHNAVVGGAFSYRVGDMDTKNETSTTSTNGYDMAVYGGADVQNARLDGMVFYNINDASSKRLMTSFGTAATDEKGWAWGASIQLSRNLFDDLITPYLRGTFARVHQDGAIESGTGTFDLAYDAINENTFAADAGLRVHVLRPQEGRKIKLDVDLAVRHDFSDPGEIITGGFATLTGSSFTYNWKGDSANALLVGVNVSDTVMDKLEVFGRLNGTFSQFRRAGEISFGAKYHL